LQSVKFAPASDGL